MSEQKYYIKIFYGKEERLEELLRSVSVIDSISEEDIYTRVVFFMPVKKTYSTLLKNLIFEYKDKLSIYEIPHGRVNVLKARAKKYYELIKERDSKLYYIHEISGVEIIE